MRSRTAKLSTIAATCGAVVLSACSSGTDAAPATVTAKVTVADTQPGRTQSGNTQPGSTQPGAGGTGSTDAGGPAAAGSGGSGTAPASSGATGSKPATDTSSSAPATATKAGTASFDNPVDGQKLPDGFVPHKLKPGQKPPQFVVVSFDGVGWDEKWQYWFDISKKVPFRFTGFLSGTYLLSDQTKLNYQPPKHDRGSSDINWNLPEDLPVEIDDLNSALAAGNEIGTHFNGHFCGAGGGSEWTEADWNQELDQFFSLLANYQKNNNISKKLNLTKDDIKGERTPCLEGTEEALFPALKKHGLEYDSSFTKRGISWPKQSPKYKIWQIGMAEFPMHGTITGNTDLPPEARTNHFQITMDYNFWYSQEQARSASPEQSKKDSQQVVDTYQDMYDATFNGNRAPLILGNHFNQWNNNAYSDAIGAFVLQTCGKPDTQCVPFRDLIAWMKVQDPARLAQLQNQPPELGKGNAG
ncbi:polysaccharide deacetylase [Nakamurella aerolata]|uniref:Polysaccharide deacetylase n=1 Tax=Nakamurella aerolata TaxID=1656892 RepID=A0A849A9E5_9ACTN|nr:polysaccharide deacetylase [Nakamurella aerolata]NNG36607.1 polysaccharide deacetylase [Nakamurella aerolata]